MIVFARRTGSHRGRPGRRGAALIERLLALVILAVLLPFPADTLSAEGPLAQDRPAKSCKSEALFRARTRPESSQLRLLVAPLHASPAIERFPPGPPYRTSPEPSPRPSHPPPPLFVLHGTFLI